MHLPITVGMFCVFFLPTEDGLMLPDSKPGTHCSLLCFVCPSGGSGAERHWDLLGVQSDKALLVK